MFKNVIGLIVEYNPFHNGHLHHIQEIDRLFEDNIKIAVMSGDYVQRGEPSLINKFEKTKIGDTVKVTYYRGGKEKTAEIVVQAVSNT